MYVAAEKDTQRQQLNGWLAPARIPVLVVRGFGSQSYANVVHERVTADPRCLRAPNPAQGEPLTCVGWIEWQGRPPAGDPASGSLSCDDKIG